MSSLYRCRARVGYRPFGSKNLIVFDEKQVQELSVKLKWKPNAAFANADASTPASAATNALSQSTCSVTVTDPYLTGLAWPALFDAAQLYTQANVASANNIQLPPCEEGQDPYTDKCHKYVDTDTQGDSAVDTNFAFLLISLWYDVKGTSFGTDFYFRVSGFSVSHGTKYPSVTIRGVEARSVVFNQSLVNINLEEGVSVEQALKELAEKQGFTTSFCVNTDSQPDRKRILPRTVRYKGVTLDEAIKKVLDSVNGQSLSLPIREYANKISMCTRGEVDQGCSVFYLGKGLYEGYEISGQPELTLLALNAEQVSNRNNADPYASDAFKANTYFIGNVTPNKRKKAMEKVKKVQFPQLFAKATKHTNGAPTLTGYVWRDATPASGKSQGVQVINEEASKIQKEGLNLFGIAPNGTTSISFLNGDVQEADEKTGRVVIKTKFSLHICEKEGSKKCFYRPIFQESTGLSTVKVKAKDKVEINQQIGTSTSDKPEFTRFYIVGHSTQFTTLNPKIVWDWAFPETEIPKSENPAPASGQPQSQAPAQQQSSGGQGQIVGRVGSTGRSTGPHVHVQESTGRTLSEAQLRSLASKYITVAGKSLTSYTQGDGFGAGRSHGGIDYPIKAGEPISVTGKIISAGAGVGGSACGNGVAFQPPEGPELLICHLQDKSIPPNIAGLNVTSGGGKSNPTIQGSPATSGLMVETSFKGVPRALRIIPGRTILSFITDYDAWVEEGRPASRDPGVWIPNRFKNWFVSECEYRWREGDVRVQIEAVSAWGTSKVTVPTFQNYLQSMRTSGDAKISSDYYDYIRSIGGLNWKTEDGKDSTEVYCKEAQELSTFLGQGGDSTSPSPSGSNTSFPPGACKTGDPTKDSIINALYSAGLNTPNAFAGALGNIQEESNFNPNIHNTPIQGVTCVTDSGVPEKCYGLVQWGGSRKIQAVRKCGQTSTLQCQLEFVVQEIKQRGGGMVQSMNRAASASAAAETWRRQYEVASGGIAKRQQFAEQIVKQIKCAKPS